MLNLTDFLEKNTVSEKQIPSNIRKRKSEFLFESVLSKYEDDFIGKGWEVNRRFKTKTRLQKRKPQDQKFEDKVWATFAGLGFKFLNIDRNFKLPYSNDENLTQQIDVFAADEETVLIIECKSTGGEPKKGNFKETIEAIGGKKDGLLKTIQKIFSGHKPKVKFIFATNNYILSKPDIERLENYGIIHFDNEMIQYYDELNKHLGIAARFQLLGFLFSGQKIPEMENKIPAIKGKMGGLTYYSFSIEPEKLLKLGYVLHRNKANKKLMPTYQRLIKKSRLKSVQEFVEGGGYFPNSLIVSIDCKKALRFDLANNQNSDCLSKLGILHLPQQYRSAYIIDGQHRLYGYANSEYKNTNTIPVVAFENLERENQVKLFMQINENQKAVPKNLRNTLNADLLWVSPYIDEQVKALKLQIAQDLGEDLDSPLYDRIIIGENKKTSTRCITIDTIRIGLDRSNYFGSFTKTAIKEDGTYYLGNNQDSYNLFLPFIKGVFEYFKNELAEIWSMGDSEDGFLAVNVGVESIIRLSSDIIDHLKQNNTIQPKTDKIDKVLKEVYYYLDPVVQYMKSLPNEDRLSLKKSYGTAGRTKYWRILQRVIREARPDFNPKDLDNYWKSREQTLVESSYSMIGEIETELNRLVKEQLVNYYGTKSWFKKGVHPKVQENSTLLALQKNREIEDPEKEKTEWDCLHIIDYRTIATYGKNWSEIFEKALTKPGEEKRRGGKDEKTKWMQKLENIRNEIAHSYSIDEDQYVFITELKEWLVDKRVDNNL
nr:DGQHR domain-containing protein [uncultured Draconibacterium sp.]